MNVSLMDSWLFILCLLGPELTKRCFLYLISSLIIHNIVRTVYTDIGFRKKCCRAYAWTRFQMSLYFNFIIVQIYVTEHVCHSSVNKNFLWTPKNFRKDTWSCKDLSILTTSARNHW